MTNDPRSEFLAEVEAYLSSTGMSPTAFGKTAMGDPRFVATVRAGRAPTLRTVERVRRFIAEHPKREAA